MSALPPVVLLVTMISEISVDTRLPSGGSGLEVCSGVRSTKSWSSEEFIDNLIYKQEKTDDFLVLHSLVILFNESSQSELALLRF